MSDLSTEVARQTHRRFESVRLAEKSLVIDRRDMPWLPKDNPTEIVHLSLVTRMVSGKNREFYVGSAIREKRLKALAAEVSESGKGSVADKIFYAGAEKLIDGQLGLSDRCREPRTKEPGASGRDIWYQGNSDAVRVYFMKMDDIDGKQVVVRVAVCQCKKKEEKIYEVIGSQASKAVRRSLYN